ncbi:MAG: GNAT family N-acetyltransferase [Promicromonosporaceae bacterium]|nr:GNAT family N-acetyltransferase [Promicromonosporaceae bacterium]
MQEISYFATLRALRNLMNLQGTVSFVHLKDLVDRLDGAWEVIDGTAERLRSLAASSTSVAASLATLRVGIKRNYAHDERMRALPRDILSEVVYGTLEQAQDRDEWQAFDSICSDSAIKYAAINATLSYHSMIESFFPTAYRGTAHAKRNQIALTDSSSQFPWNGIAVSRQTPRSFDDIRTVPAFTLSEYERVSEVRLASGSLPLYFRVSEPAVGDIGRAQLAWPLGTSEVAGLGLREFQEGDLPELLRLGREDARIMWDWAEPNKDRYRQIIGFRIGHYRKHQFGVLALVDPNGSLVGQCGLQVMAEGDDEVEFVVYLGRSYQGRGLGSRITTTLLEKCWSVGVSQVYGLVRADNQAANRMILGLGGEFCGTQRHFGFDAIRFRFPRPTEEEKE